MITIPLRAKHRAANAPRVVQRGEWLMDVTKSTAPKHAYRGRTGPRCCNDNCPANRGRKHEAKVSSKYTERSFRATVFGSK